MRCLFLPILIITTLAANAQTRNFRLVRAATESPTSQHRKAVVIGMSDYGAENHLTNTLNDADDMATVLTQLGFEVTLLKNNDLRSLKTNLDNWYNAIENNDMAIFYFSGHGMEISGENYLLPVDININSETDVQYETYSLSQVLGNMDERKVGMKMVIIDACRNNTFKKSWHRGGESKGLAQVIAPKGTYIAFATAPREVADDGGTYGFKNGVFTYYLKTEINKQDLSIDQIFDNIIGDVTDKTHSNQTPYITKNIQSSRFYFKPPVINQQASNATVIVNPANNQQIKPAPSPLVPIVPSVPNGMVLVQGGTFNMGSTSSEASDGEKPAHSVTVSSFYIGKYEVTVAEYRAFCAATSRAMPEEPSWHWQQDNPIVNVRWDEATAYCAWLGQKTGKNYRLPTEAEWEFAARGGLKSAGYTYSGSNNAADAGWIRDNAGGQTHPVGQKTPNELGLYDMTGNVWEWCGDWYGPYSNSAAQNPQGPATGTHRVMRGGCWNYFAGYGRVSLRYFSMPGNRYFNMGFRVVCNL